MTLHPKNRSPLFLYINVLLFGMFLCGCVAVLLGKEVNFDLANYHYSNAYLFLHHAANQDIWPPSFFHAYLAPTPDLLSYFLINYTPSWIATFIMGAIAGINIFLLFLIAELMLSTQRNAFILALITAFLGLFGGIGFLEIGTFKNDHLISVFVLLFIYGQLRALQLYYLANSRWKYPLLLASCSLGIALGLKLTASNYVAAAWIAYLFLAIPWRDRLYLLIYSGIAITAGLLLSSGYWMWELWQLHHNPFFPFLNRIFHSPDFPIINWHFTQFLPENRGLLFFYPIYFSMKGTIPDGFFIDLRYAYVYLLLIITGLVAFWKKLTVTRHSTIDIKLSWLIYFSILSCALSIYTSGGIRYSMVVEMLAPLLIYLLLDRLIHSVKCKNIMVAIIYLSMIITMIPANKNVRTVFDRQDYFQVSIPSDAQLPSDAIVLMSYSEYTLFADPRPTTFLVAFFPPQWHFIGIPFAHQLYQLPDSVSFNKARQLLAKHAGKIFLLAPASNMSELYHAAMAFNLIPAGPCESIGNIRSTLLQQGTLLCPVSQYSLLP